MKDLIVLFGKKQSGKTTSATAIYGYHLTQRGIIPNAEFDEDGVMSVIYNKDKDEGIIFDIDSRDPEMVSFYRQNIWAHVKHVSFADALKESCIKLFSLDPKLVYGTNDDKNSETHLKIENICKLLPPERAAHFLSKGYKNLTIRKLLEIFGTEICRTIDDDCHIRSAHTELIRLNPEIGIIPDGRFSNEFRYFQKIKKARKSGTRVWLIKHARSVHKSDAPSETGMPEIDEKEFDLVIPEGLNMVNKNNLLVNFLVDNKVLSSTGVQIY